MNELVITTFTDPMMGLSYECEPMYRKLETHFPQARFRYIMSVLVRDVSHFMLPCETLPQYNKRLAKIYEAEENISGMPIYMPELHLFDDRHRTSEPLNLAYKAAQITDKHKADLFLYNLRYATIVERRPTTHFEEILHTVRETGINEERFKEHYKNGSARIMLEHDLRLVREHGIRTLPAYMIQYGDKSVVVTNMISYPSFVEIIGQLSDGEITPLTPGVSAESIYELIKAHPLISPIELREAFDLGSTDEVMKYITEIKNITVEEVPHGCFIRLEEER